MVTLADRLVQDSTWAPLDTTRDPRTLANAAYLMWRRKHPAVSVDLANAALASEDQLTPEQAHRVLTTLAKAARRVGDRPRQGWAARKLVAQFPVDATARRDLAIYEERVTRNLPCALEHARYAQHLAPSAVGSRRVERLERRVEAARPSVDGARKAQLD